MRAFIFLFLFGTLSMVGLFLSVFWARITLIRGAAIKYKWSWHQDRYFILSAGVALSSSGLVIVYGSRLLANLFYGLSPLLQYGEAWPIGIGLTLLSLGYLFLVWLADLEVDPPRWGWLRAMLAVTVVWGVASMALSPHVPLFPDDTIALENDGK